MRLSIPLRAWLDRVLRLDPSRVSLGLAILLALVSLSVPFWSYGWTDGSDQEISSFAWNKMWTDTYENGEWSGTVTVPYRLSTFPTVAGVLGTSYLFVVVFIVVLLVVLGLFWMGYTRTMPTLSLLIISLLVVAVGLFALFYPLVAIPGAATTDLGLFTFTAFWGSWRTTAPARDWSWSPALGWWCLFVASVLGILGASLPYLKSVRAMAPAKARPEQPST